MSQSRKRQEPWRANERHYCAVCNSWMGSDRQSILIHENGKKHRENMEASLKKRRDDKLQSEKDRSMLVSSLKKMEQAAALAHLSDVASGAFSGENFSMNSNVCMNAADSSKKENLTTLSKSEKKAWQDRKQKRKSDDDNDETKMSHQEVKRQKSDRIELERGEGHYVIDDKTYLEGTIFYPLFEEDMPVQIWIGSMTTSVDYRKSKEALDLWKTGLIIRIREPKGDSLTNESFCDVAYLRDVNDDDETIEKDVSVERLRLILGSDDMIPKTVEESRLQLMGGEEIIAVDDGKLEIDENTGLSTFRTISVRKVTVSQEVKNERARARAKRQEDIEKEKNKLKEMEARKMEEAKHSNADDSALGAYDVWGKGGYKGININAEVKLDASDTGKSLSEGKKNITFKKRNGGKQSAFKTSKKKQNQRKTFADSDDE
jgi:WW domain-binding protein 4